jgi:hypothetical protein
MDFLNPWIIAATIWVVLGIFMGSYMAIRELKYGRDVNKCGQEKRITRAKVAWVFAKFFFGMPIYGILYIIEGIIHFPGWFFAPVGSER